MPATVSFCAHVGYHCRSHQPLLSAVCWRVGVVKIVDGGLSSASREECH